MIDRQLKSRHENDQIGYAPLFAEVVDATNASSRSAAFLHEVAAVVGRQLNVGNMDNSETRARICVHVHFKRLAQVQLLQFRRSVKEPTAD